MQWIIDIVQNHMNDFQGFAKENPVIAGAISLWGLGFITYFGRDIPRRIWNDLLYYSTTTLTVDSTHEAFFKLLKWVNDNNYLQNTRTIKISNSGAWSSGSIMKTAGYGTHYFFYGWNPIQFTLTKLDSQGTYLEKNEIKITKLGRSHELFNRIFNDIKKKDKNKDKIRIKKWTDKEFITIEDQRKRGIDTVFIEEEKKNNIINFIENFKDKEDFYVKNGLNYHTGILLYGPAGTGKTSLVKAIASHFNRPLYILNAKELYNIEGVMISLEENAILLIEDIDTDSATFKRVEDEDDGKPKNPDEKKKMPVFTMGSFSSLGEILNAIDGITTVHGRILIATTNHIEKLDSALIRTGRFDLKVELGYTTPEIVRQFWRNYFPDEILPENFEVKERMPTSDVQTIIINNLEDSKKAFELIVRKNNV